MNVTFGNFAVFYLLELYAYRKKGNSLIKGDFPEKNQ